MNTPVAFEIRIPRLTPETTPLGELADVLVQTERAIRALADASEDEGLIVGLVGVQRGSTVLHFGSAQHSRVHLAWVGFTHAIAVKQTSRLPKQARDAIAGYANFARRHSTPVMLADAPGKKPVAEIGPGFQLDFSAPMIRGESVIYGMVARVGGTDPKVRVLTDTGKAISCDVTMSVAKQLGSRLYERVGLRGMAVWDSTDWSLTSFNVTEVLGYVETPITEAIQLLAQASGPDAWADEPDIDLAIAKLRQDDDL